MTACLDIGQLSAGSRARLALTTARSRVLVIFDSARSSGTRRHQNKQTGEPKGGEKEGPSNGEGSSFGRRKMSIQST